MGIRWDSHGLLWEDAPPEPRGRAQKSVINRPLPEIPDTGWVAPKEFPRLEAAREIAIDTETRDPNLKELGPGDCRGDGEVVGISIGVDEKAWYFPIRHTVAPEQNLDPEKVLAWLGDELSRHPGLKVGHRLGYDLGWLAAEGVSIPGPYFDTSIAEALLDENLFDYSLDTLAEKRLGTGKEDEALYDWCYRAYGGKLGRSQIANIWRAPACLAGPYAEQDARLPLLLKAKQTPLLEEEGLSTIASIEMRLIGLLLAMRRRGVRVNTQAAEELDSLFEQNIVESRARFKHITGFEFIDSNDKLARAFDTAGIKYLKTAKGNPSFPKDWLEHHPSPLAKAVIDIRKWEKNRGTFVEGYTLRHAHEGRIHAEINQIRFAGDSQGERGTIGRFSYTNPNLQNIPSRDEEMKRLIRGLFLPEEGEVWESRDYSQVEFRMLAHFAMGPGSSMIRKNYRTNPDIDYHDSAQAMVSQVANIDLDRKPTKNLNFGLVFGMGKDKVVRSLGVDYDTGLELYDAYHEAMPFAGNTYRLAMNTAQRRGYIKTLLGRRRRFNLWESKDWKTSREDGPMPYDAAIEKYGRRRIRRAMTNSSLNNVLQLSAADAIKKAMVDIWESGVCDVIGPPLIQVHDELNFSRGESPEAIEASREIRRLMVTVVDDILSVPLAVSLEIGPDWGHLEKIEE